MIIILKIKKSHRDGSWIVYNPDNFQLHTHCRSLRAALVVRNNVNHRRMPESRDIELVVSHLRVTKNKRYAALLQKRIEELRQEKYHNYIIHRAEQEQLWQRALPNAV